MDFAPYDTPYALRVDYLPREALPLPGRLGLTRAPGRWSAGRAVDSDLRLREDLAALAEVHGAKVLVTLVERQELAELGDLRREARRARLTWIHFPIPDAWVPSDVGATRMLVDRLLRALERGEDVIVHCWGGLGRAGTIAAACLVARGTAPAEAIAVVRATREGAVQTFAQERFVHDLWDGGR
jgi:protein-tyrosine phosphatase